jgi:tetratricopeptide (TPR) repeat protein
MDRDTPTRRTILICALLAAATLITFWPQTSHDFISYDDGIYITGNPHVRQGLTWENVGWAFSAGEAGNWHPLTWLSHMLDVQLFGLRAGWHHLASLVLHAANTLLLFLLLDRLTRAAWRSAFVAALFALHPLHVQSVAWAAERKDVLSAFFFFLTLLAYARYAEKAKGQGLEPEVGRERGGTFQVSSFKFQVRPSLAYGLALGFFALGLMSKPMLVTVPFVLLLLDVWPLGRLRRKSEIRNPKSETNSKTLEGDKRRKGEEGISFSTFHSQFSIHRPLILEKVPFFALALVSCVVTVWAQRRGGAVVPIGLLPFWDRLANALVAYVAYLKQAFWPTNLAILYPLGEPVPLGTLVGSVILLLAVTAWTVWNLRRRSWLGVGWFWYVGMLIPTIGLVQVGMQQKADRYTYLPLIGVFLMLAWEISERLGTRRVARTIRAAAASLVLAACVIATRRQLVYWQDSELLFGRAVEVTPANYVALNDYGLALLKAGKVNDAIKAFERAVALHPDLDAARCGLGTALMEQKKYEEAADQFKRVLDLEPDNTSALLQLGILHGRQGRLDEAAAAFSRALRRNPEDPGAHNNFGNVLLLQGKYAEALEQFEAAVRLQPDYSVAYNNLAICCKKLGRVADAIAHYRQALRLQPDSFEALNNLAWMLATQPDARLRNGQEAVQLATRACELTNYQNPIPLATLAAAFAETGRFEEAVAYAGRAIELFAGSRSAVAAQLPAMLEAFRAGHPYHSD